MVGMDCSVDGVVAWDDDDVLAPAAATMPAVAAMLARVGFIVFAFFVVLTPYGRATIDFLEIFYHVRLPYCSYVTTIVACIKATEGRVNNNTNPKCSAG